MPEGCSPEREASLREWLAYRTDLRKPYKPTSWTKLMTQLAVLDDGQLKACVDASIANQWTGLFPEKFERSGFENGRFSEKKGGGAALPMKQASEEPSWDWRGLARELWPDARLEGPWDQLPSSTRYELRELRRKKIEGAGAADFPWAAVFTDHLGWDLAKGVEWVDLTAEQRKELRAAWSALSKDAKAAMWELSTGGCCEHE